MLAGLGAMMPMIMYLGELDALNQRWDGQFVLDTNAEIGDDLKGLQGSWSEYRAVDADADGSIALLDTPVALGPIDLFLV